MATWTGENEVRAHDYYRARQCLGWLLVTCHTYPMSFHNSNIREIGMNVLNLYHNLILAIYYLHALQ